MPDKIEDILHRRTDLSTFLVHFTRNTSEGVARENLLDILEARVLAARTPLGMAQQYDEHLQGTEATQRVVCFSETPLEHSWTMIRDIEGRQQEFQPYGLVFSKTISRRKGCNPVWYLDITVGHDWLTEPIRKLVAEADQNSRGRTGRMDPSTLAVQSVFRLTPFIEQMGKPRGIRKEFWWEREWRHAGDFSFAPSDVVAVLAPEREHRSLEEKIDDFDKQWERRGVPLLDPTWGLERMIARLARVGDDALGPFPA